jgi:hypothetical protein
MNHISVTGLEVAVLSRRAEVEGFPATGAGGDLPKTESPNLSHTSICSTIIYNYSWHLAVKRLGCHIWTARATSSF